MNESIIEVLKKLEDAGYEAYIVGGYVRDFLMGNSTNDIDICTNALPMEIANIFNKKTNSKYGVVNIRYKEYSFDISTYRKEIKYINRKNIDIEYISDIKNDIQRRDFTINSMYMDKNENIIDLFNGKKDLLNKNIKLIGSSTKLKDDPLRILRAIRFATVLDFDIDASLDSAIYEYKNFVASLSKERIKEEIDIILLSQNYKKGLDLLKKYGLLELIGIRYTKIKFVDDICGMYSQLDIDNSYPFTKNEQNNIKSIKAVVKKGTIDNEVLFDYGLYTCIVASKILDIDTTKVTNMYNKLPITNIKELNITIIDIKEKINCNFDTAKKIYKKLLKDVINGSIINEYEQLIESASIGDDLNE